MQFNSYIFILLFLPVTTLFYFLGNRFMRSMGKAVLVISSIIFYIYADSKMAFVLGVSIVINYTFALLLPKAKKYGKAIFAIPVIINVAALLYYKYSAFFITNVNTLFNASWTVRNLIMPLGISFFTFQQIAYLAYAKNSETSFSGLMDYLVYILYFPKLIMGPLMEPSDFISQLNDEGRTQPDLNNIACGIKIFCFGLFKKVVLADTMSQAVGNGFRIFSHCTAADWVLVMLFYTFEIYFDFSGYSDMATGASLMLNIELPINFNSPYKALNIRDFWKRWHISLTAFFTKYIYIPLGGSRKGKAFTYLNTMIVFLISGIWHGANWTFILWGILHGLLMVFDRAADSFEKKIPKIIRWGATFFVINVLCLLFRAESVGQWIEIMGKVFSFRQLTVSEDLIICFLTPGMEILNHLFHIQISEAIGMLLYLTASMVICIIPENNFNKLRRLSRSSMVTAAIAFVLGFICMSRESVFVYFNF